jgi:hypothetical protein
VEERVFKALAKKCW